MVIIKINTFSGVVIYFFAKEYKCLMVMRNLVVMLRHINNVLDIELHLFTRWLLFICDLTCVMYLMLIVCDLRNYAKKLSFQKLVHSGKPVGKKKTLVEKSSNIEFDDAIPHIKFCCLEVDITHNSCRNYP